MIYQALEKNVSWLEVSGQEGGEIAMVGAIKGAIERSPEFQQQQLTITTRLGYRSVEDNVDNDEDEEEESTMSSSLLPGDVVATEQVGPGQEKIVHNLSSDYLLSTVHSSPLLTELKELENLRLVFLIQNPEVQVLELLKDDPKASLADRQAYIGEKWQPALETLQEFHHASAEHNNNNNNNIFSFGVVSNGLGIPEENNHPMHMSADTVISAAKAYDGFTTVLLPANLLETHGWDMARRIHSEAPSVTIGAIRPLTCYPDLGTGTGYPFRLVDYALPSLSENPLGAFGDEPNIVAPSHSENKKEYTNDMMGPPTIYQLALQTAMSHFDAEELLEIKQTRDLTMEERESWIP